MNTSCLLNLLTPSLLLLSGGGGVGGFVPSGGVGGVSPGVVGQSEAMGLR